MSGFLRLKTALLIYNENSYAEGMVAGMSSGKVNITAHFHDIGEVTFESDDTSTAQEKYQAYIDEHPLKEQSSTQTTCFTESHSTSGHSELCGYWNESREGSGRKFTCSGCGYSWVAWDQEDYDKFYTPCHTRYIAGYSYYGPTCGHTDGKILRIEVVF